MSRNLNRLTYAANKIQAWEDFRNLAQRAIDTDRRDLAEKYCPPLNASMKRIDKASAELRKALGEPCPNCHDTGKFITGYVQGYFCICEIGQKMKSAA